MASRATLSVGEEGGDQLREGRGKRRSRTKKEWDEEMVKDLDAVVIGSGVGGLTAATQLAARGKRVLVLEKYIIPGGSAASYERDGYTLDVGSSMMFGFGDEGTTNLLTRALAAAGRRIETVPDPVQIHYHLPGGLEVRVHRDYDDFINELVSLFPHEERGIRGFYGECWTVFNALNSLELKSLEEPRYLLGQFLRDPLACFSLLRYVGANAGDVARKHIRDEELLRFIDIECYCWSTVLAESTPMINAGMVFCDRHFGGINYPVGGVGRIARELAAGLEDLGGEIAYGANVQSVIIEDDRAVGVRLANGREVRARTVISNATRWDTFEKLLPAENKPEPERLFLQRYEKSPSFLTMHLGIDAEAVPQLDDKGFNCHHIVVEDWDKMEEPSGTLFVSVPTTLDRSIAPPGRHIVHAFTPEWVSTYDGLSAADYRSRKEERANAVIARLETALRLPGLREAARFREVGTPRTHRRFLNRTDGSYGPIPSRPPLGMLGMPMNTTAIPGLYCTGDSTFPGQGVNAVAFSGMGAAHRIAVDLSGDKIPVLDAGLKGLLNTVRDKFS